MKPHPRSRHILPGLGLLLAFWLTRLVAIEAFPPFLDESLHVEFADYSLRTSPLAHSNQGRLFTIWLYAVFQAPAGATFWIARVANLLAILPAVAAIMGVGRLLAGRRGMLLAGLLYLFSTYHLFFDRLALADPLAAAGVSLALYFASRVSLRVDYRDAALTGLALFLALGAKNTVLPYFGIPLAAVVALSPRRDARRGKLGWLAVALGTALGLTGAFTLGLALLGYDYFALVGVHNPDVTGGLASRLVESAGATLALLLAYLGPVGLGVLGAALVALLLRRRFYLPLCLLAPLAVIWASQRQSTRFYHAALAILLLCGAVALAHAMRNRSRLAQSLGSGLVILYGAAHWLPFAWTAYHTPIRLPLFAGDYLEYVASDASGFGLSAVQGFLQGRQVSRVIGVLPNCQGLRYLALDSFPVACPRVNPNGEDIQALADLLAASRAQGVYAVPEDSPYVPDRAPGDLLTTVERPGGGPSLAIYDLSP